jgi:hypothetical protein
MKPHLTFTLQSSNKKTGPIPVSTSDRRTCPTACPFYDAGCYASYGPLGGMWKGLSAAGPDSTFRNGRGNVATLGWQAFLKMVRKLDANAIWRHNQAGDLPGIDNAIDATALGELVKANKGKRGFTYTHKPMDNAANAAAVAKANANGFTINLSADSLSEADELSALNIGPVVVVLSDAIQGKQSIATPNGHVVVVCPATYRDDVTCKSCGLCSIRDRKTIVGFPAHGAAKRKAAAIVAAL